MTNFTDTFDTHFFIEMCYGRKNKFGFLYEQNLRGNDFKRLCESYGLFNGCEKIAEQIYDEAEEAFEEDIYNFTIHMNDCDFIESINVKLEYNKICSYDTRSVIDDEDKYNPLVLNIGILNNVKDIKVLIMHELTHAYEDYNRIINNKGSLFNKASELGYGKNHISNTQSFNRLKQKVSNILYHFTDFERNAYIAQMKANLINCEENFTNIKDALAFVKNTITYRNYQTIFKWARQLCEEKDAYKQSKVLAYVRDLSNLKFDNYNQFVKWLKNKLFNYQRKFNTIVPKMAAEYLNMVESLHSPFTELIQ